MSYISGVEPVVAAIEEFIEPIRSRAAPLEFAQCSVKRRKRHSVAEPALRWEAAPAFWDDYAAERLLGSGKSGQVWLIRDRRGDSYGVGASASAAPPFALKVFGSKPDNEMEFQVLRALNELCDWFPQYHGLYRVPDPANPRAGAPKQLKQLRHALLMEYIAGEQADYWADRGQHLPEELIGIAQQLLCQLACMHAAGFLHRDIKPSNVLISASQPRRAYLVDFGVACALAPPPGEPALLGCSSAAGDMLYQAPEIYEPQLDGTFAAPTRASDVYSLGLALLRLLRPSADAWPRQPLQKRKQVDKLRFYQAPTRDTLSRADPLERTVRWMLQSNPMERPTAEQALGAL